MNHATCTTSETDAAYKRRAGTVFIVDDDASFRHSLDILLSATGLTTKTFASATEFLGAFLPSSPECLILDVRLPGMGGVELLTELDARQMTIPVIIVSACADPATIEQAKAARVFDYLIKPYNAPALLDRIHEALDVDASAP